MYERQTSSVEGMKSAWALNVHINELLQLMVDKGASDLHITVPSPPVLRIEGELVSQDHLPPITPEDASVIFEQITNEEQKEVFRKELQLDFAYSVPGLARFRVNALRQRGSISLAFRFVPFRIPSIDELQLPQICKKLILKQKGLILITGQAGSGKSTTLAAMINHLNQTERRNVITIEDPIEFLFSNNKCIIRQRDLGNDARSFHSALVNALRHDLDVIVIAELRDLHTISTAITAAETGHLVLGTMHTIDAAQSIDRMIDIFPGDQQQQIRSQLSQVLEAVFSQTLLSRIGGGRIAAFEIMIATAGIKKLIREGRIHEINSNLEHGAAEGKQTMEQALNDLIKKNIIDREEALAKSYNPKKLLELLQ